MTPITEVQRLIATRTAVRQEILVNPGNRYLEYVSASGQMIRMPNVIREFDPSWEDVPLPSAETVIIKRDGILYGCDLYLILLEGNGKAVLIQFVPELIPTR